MAWIVSSRAIVQPGGTRKRSTEEENQGEKSAEYEENGVGNTKIRPDSAAPSRKTEKRNQTKIYPFSSLFLHQTPSLPHPRDTGSRENYPRRSSHTDHAQPYGAISHTQQYRVIIRPRICILPRYPQNTPLTRRKTLTSPGSRATSPPLFRPQQSTATLPRKTRTYDKEAGHTLPIISVFHRLHKASVVSSKAKSMTRLTVSENSKSPLGTKKTRRTSSCCSGTPVRKDP